MKIRAIITGATGMVGEGVLHECLLHPEVESVLVINRRPCHVTHEKLKEIIHADFSNFNSIEDELTGYNAGYFCMGVSSVGMKEEKYHYLTYELTLALATVLQKVNPEMTVCYISGTGTNSSERGSSMWARVKGKTENSLLKLFPEKAYMFRPGYIQPTEGLNHTYTIYKYAGVLYPVWKFVFPKYVTSLREVGLAMIEVSRRGSAIKILECSDINMIAKG